MHDFDRLRERHASSQQLDQVSGSDDAVWIPSFASGLHCHRALYQVQLSHQTELLQLVFDQGPDFFDVLLPVLRKEAGETGLFLHAMRVVFWLERFNCPLVQSWVVVPWFVLSVSLVFVHRRVFSCWLVVFFIGHYQL